ncbi:gamma-glutamyltranspeptidase / glutathione hydrolase [Tindallia magadiensis]|uniref:Glutathione hydrolase proenzyme n=1 Tax=Tindallia magadiensis TaxID=69895 RepID=A0A1I3DLZ2_9FIRM|nr:gamma-glutamyltransferase [Tindallia magadiensis]SFH87772.1 gamma-glutamyltranspeptidase / glutathione hydrolase [Tindallia magadiensis]
MNFSSLQYPYPSKRNLVYGQKGMVASSQPLAAQAGLDMLKKGGNAIDAAIATAACLTVVEPTSNGIGGDAFALVWAENDLHGLNASGPAPANLSLEYFEKQGLKEMPVYGPTPITVPGAPAAWAELSERFGNLSLKTVMKPAIQYAREGFPVAPATAYYWKKAYQNALKNYQGEVFKHWFDVFAPQGRAPEPGEIWKSEEHATTLEVIAATMSRDFYEGIIAKTIDEFLSKHHGKLKKEDLESYQVRWEKPISAHYRGYDVWEIPPNGQGLIALQALSILEGMELDTEENGQTVHRIIESLKLAFTDGKTYIADPDHMPTSVESLLSKEYIESRRAMISENALLPEPGMPPRGGTVYLATADGEGNMVSMIQSNYMGFGSGVVIPGTGIALHNRGHNFSLDPRHPNALAPGKRPYHTIIPGFLTKKKKPLGPFGVMGGFMQPQGHLQVITKLIDFQLNPQAALDAPRWQWLGGKKIEVEQDYPELLIQQLVERGHDISIQRERGNFGRGQIILRNENGVLCGATEPRTDGCVAVW